MVSKYLLRVERVDGQPVYLKPGGSSERELQSNIISKATKAVLAEFNTILDTAGLLADIAERGVGVARTEAHVLNDVQAAIDSHQIRTRLSKAVSLAIQSALHDTLLSLKSDVQPL